MTVNELRYLNMIVNTIAGLEDPKIGVDEIVFKVSEGDEWRYNASLRKFTQGDKEPMSPEQMYKYTMATSL